MGTDATPQTHTPRSEARERVVFDYTTGAPGPCLVVVAGLHGDEPAAVSAVERVRDALARRKPPVHGRAVAVLGNLAAIAAGKRYLEEDLNRNWDENTIADVLARDPAGDAPEERERRELAEFINGFDDAPQHPVVFVDLHSTSAEGLPFSCMPDTLTNLRIALQLPIPAILGLEDSIRGPLTGVLTDRGYPCVIIEGGKHDNPHTVDILEASVWRLLTQLGMLHRNDVPDRESHERRLTRAGRDLPRVLEIRYQHETRAGDGFVMEPGFEHYDRVAKGQKLASDSLGDIHARVSARIIMPAYKPGTDQGFFIARDVSWLKVKILFLLRKLGVGNLVQMLPGTRIHSGRVDHMEIASWVPRRFVDVIRLLGWRRTHHDEDHTILRRRRVRVKPHVLKVERRVTPR